MARKKSTNAVPFACGPGAVAVALQGPPVEIWWTTWDHGADCFLPWRILPLPTLFGKVGFLAAGFVANFEHGLYQACLVVQRGFSVIVGLLDFENEQCHVLAEISLHGCFPSKKKFSSHPEDIVEDCWLVDGPTVMATCHGRILVASPQCVTDGPAWRAHVVMPQQRNAWKGAKLVYCGNVGSEAVFVSIPPPRDDGHSTDRSSDGSSFSLLLDSAISPTYTTPLSGLMPSLAIPLVKDFGLVRLSHLKASSITCLVSVPYPEGHSFGRVTEDKVDVVFGTTSRNLIRWRDGKVAALLEFEEVPSSVYFAVVGGGQGILLVVFKGEAHDITAVCAETNTKLKSWTGVSGVLVSDICMWGHDQIILFPKSKYWNSGLDGEDRGNIVISDLIVSLHLGSGVLLSQSEVRSTQDLPSFMTDSIWMSLNSRVQAGLLEFNDVEVEKSRKMELLRSSCCLVQEMESGPTQENWSDVQRSDQLAIQFIRAVSTTQKVYNSTWFLMVEIEGHLPKGTELNDLSLVLTTQHGYILGESSTLGSLSQGAAGQIIATSPLMDFSGLSSLSVNVLLTAMLSTGDIQEAACSDAPAETIMSCGHDDFCKPLHLPQSLSSPSSSLGPGILTTGFGFLAVAKQQHLVISSTGVDHLSVLPAIIKSSLSMVDNCHTETLDSRVLEFVMPPGLPWAQITAALFSTIAVLSLRSGSSRHIVLMEGCLKRSLKHRFKFLPRACAPDMSVHATQFASDFLRELAHFVDGEQMKVGSKRKQKDSDRQLTVSSLQFVTDRLCSHFLPITSPATELEL